MKEMIQDYGMSIFYALLSVILIVCMLSLLQNNQIKSHMDVRVDNDSGTNIALSVKEKPTLEVKSLTIPQYSPFNYLDFVVTAKAPDGTDIKDQVQCYGEVDTNIRGAVNIILTLPYDGVISRQEVTVIID